MLGIWVLLLCGSFASASFVANITLDCNEYYESIPESWTAPSQLTELAASMTVDRGDYLLNISWAVAIDSTIKYVEGIVIDTSQDTLKCEYIPPLSEAHIPETQERPIWFHHTVVVLAADMYLVQASLIPQQPTDSGSLFKSVIVDPPRIAVESVTMEPRSFTTSAPTTETPDRTPVFREDVAGGALIICVTLLLFGLVIYKVRGACVAMDYKRVGFPVPVLVVYPAQSALFQRAVGALAEFLQQNGGCSVAVDMWQQGSVAKLGPMRWLLEQVQAAHTVLIVAPQPSPQTLPIPGASIPAAARDLYALALNLVAGQAKSSTDLAKFWVVRFGESAALTPELKACRRFSLMKDLNKLCRCLHKRKQDISTKIADHILLRNNCSRLDTEKLHVAVQALNEQQENVTKDQEIQYV